MNALSPLPARPLLERGMVRLLGAGLAAATYLLFLPWDLRNRAASPGDIDETSPVTDAGITGVVVTVLALAAYFGYRDRLYWVLPVVATPPAGLLLASFLTHESPDASLWPVAWVVFVVAGGGVVLAVAGFVRQFRPQRRSRPRAGRRTGSGA
ncbi:hypothetical protein [Streptomyces spectabilis]|uniref:Uncharacterized protein n=1 Tax=Streptomyces spectabilis TaxID=68270 RepID=A0A5P2XN98_STRST|nr:hypothetical protein [Streptomyces spectabilis]MBB5106350.1 hypothetical protein [Streptomyces spectabilis]MCI3902960.1 hypothetical protein [Streptomyces spectabilis]QEV64719.1 hypothetical protein CP982_17070 [Streptomyces spectabilis]